MVQKDVDKQLKQWREDRARKTTASASQSPAARRTLRVNGQDVVVIKRGRSKLQEARS